MQRLKNAHRGERAVVVFGGPSLIDQAFDLGALRRKDLVVFLDTKSLTPRLLESGLQPDYYLMLFPEKSKDNALEHYIYRSFLAGFNIRPFIKREWRPILEEMRTRFDAYFQPWRTDRGPHKRYRWRPDVYLPDSPFAFIERIPGAKLIASRTLLDEYFPAFPYHDRTFYVETLNEAIEFTLERYYAPVEKDGQVFLRGFRSLLNSAAIGVYPLLHYMGFAEVYCLGMDMSMLGTMEYAAPFTFKSMWHFRWFFNRTHRVFNADYRPNRPYYFRPASEFGDLLALAAGSPLQIVRVYDPGRFAAPVPGLPTMRSDRLLAMAS